MTTAEFRRGAPKNQDGSASEVGLETRREKTYFENGVDEPIDTIVGVSGSSSGLAFLPLIVEFGVEDSSECNTRYLREGPRLFSGI